MAEDLRDRVVASTAQLQSQLLEAVEKLERRPSSSSVSWPTLFTHNIWSCSNMSSLASHTPNRACHENGHFCAQPVGLCCAPKWLPWLLLYYDIIVCIENRVRVSC